MGIRLPKYITKTWQTLFSPNLQSSSKAKDSHVGNGRTRAPSQSNEQLRGEQGGASENHLNPGLPDVVQHSPKLAQHVQRSPDVAARQSQVETQDPPKHRPEEAKSPAPIRNFPEEVQPLKSQPVAPEPVDDSSGVKQTRKHEVVDEALGDERDRQIISLKRELEESTKISEENVRNAQVHVEKYQQLQETLKQQKINITELTETILRTVHSRAITIRDDDYFEVEFARLANSIHQWVFRYFNLVSEVKHGALPPIVKECLNNTIFEYSKLQDQKVKRKEIEAAVSERIYSCVFRSPFLFGKNGMGYRAVRSILGGTELEKRNWEVQTVDLAVKSDNYNDQLREAILSIAKDLHHEFDSLAKEGSGEYRHKSLYAILEQAAKLRMETARQVSPIRLPKIVPGCPFNPSTMEDRLNAADEDEDEDEEERREFSVQMVLVPPVKRRVFDEAGNFVESIIVRKGTVIAIQSGS